MRALFWLGVVALVRIVNGTLRSGMRARMMSTGRAYEIDHVGVHTPRRVRREAKRRVFVVNALRALRQVAPGGNLRALEFVVLLGGSALDFEIPDMIADALAPHGIVCGTGNVLGTEGPRNAVASGLVRAHAALLAEQARCPTG